MREIPREIETELEKLELTFHERQALAIYAQEGVSPPDWLGERIARRIGLHKFVRAWAILKGDEILNEVVQSNLRASLDNLAMPLLTAQPA